MHRLVERPPETSGQGAARLAPPAVSITRLATDPPGMRERLLFTVSCAAIAAHVLVEAFVALEPGTDRRDHLLAALVPLALLGTAVLLYLRLKAGLRASVALMLGMLALVGGAVAVVDATQAGPSGDDWTGFLLLPAGLVLCVLGIMTLWRSRKPYGRRWLRRAGLVVVAVAVAYWIVLPIGFAIVATDKPRATVEPADLGRPSETVALRTSDELELSGWYVPSQNGAAVIAFPGRTNPVEHARMLVRNGYGVLLLDMRGQGESEGDPNGFGWGSAKDLDAAVAFLEARPDVDAGRIGGLGLSVGGEVLLEAAAGNGAIQAVVSEGAGLRSVRETLAREGVTPLLVWLQLPNEAVLTAATAVLGGDAPPPSLEQLAAQIAPRPVFFIYAGEGQSAEIALTPAYHAAAGEPKTLWEIPEAEHTGGIDARPQEYEDRVIEFFDEALLGEG
jgi:fermentation-respiration switch protein FrsA (DUF1100 family)